MQHFNVGSLDHKLSLLDFLSSELGISKSAAKKVLDAKAVFVNGSRTWIAKATLRRGDTVEVQADAVSKVGTRPVQEPIQVLHEDSDYLVVSKPAGIITNEDPMSLESVLREQLSRPELLAVHRLDRDTSGCVIFATSAQAKKAIETLFNQRAVLKIYHAIAVGAFPATLSEISKPIAGKSALTRVQLLSSAQLGSHLRVKISTGRTHQIRKHLAGVRHPIVGDKDYFSFRDLPPELRSVERQMLHARVVQFKSPISNKLIRAEASLPKDFMACLRKLKLR